MWKDPNVRQQLKSVPVRQRVQKGIELANAGIFRLSETQQTRWLLLSGRLFEGSQERNCAALVKGAVTIDMIFRLLNRLSEAEIQEYYDLVTVAVTVDATPNLPPAPRATDTPAAFQIIYNGLSLSEQTRFRTAAMSAQLAGGRDACWLGHTLFSRIAGLPPAMRTNLIQAFTNGQAPAGSQPALLQVRQF